MKRSAKQRAENESRFRAANEQIEAKALELSLTDEPGPYLCECDDDRCTTIVQLTVHEYERVRSRPTQFVTARNHHSAPDRIVEERPSYTVIEKTGEEARIVAEQDPRS